MSDNDNSKEQQPLKMYILIKYSVDLGHAILGAAHASLGGYLDFTSQVSMALTPELAETTDQWVTESFRKVVCKVTDEEFDRAYFIAREGNMKFRAMQESALGDGDISLVFAPRRDWPKFFKYLKLYR